MVVAPTWDERLAHVLSNVFHPFIVTTLTVPLVIAFTGPNLLDALKWTGYYIGLVIAPPLILLLVRVRTQQVESVEVAVRQQRTIFYTLGIGGLLLLVLLMHNQVAPDVLRACVYAAIATNLVAAAVNHLVTKISVHAAAIAGCTAVLVAVAPWPLWAGAVALTLLQGWARVRLARHTVGQVLLGWAVAIGSVVIVFRMIV